MAKKKKQNRTAVNDYHQACGPVRISMTNDYLFKALMQRNERVLKALVCALLHLKTDEISRIELLNPIVLGEYAEEKDIILDVNVCLNDEKVLDLELQVADEKNWTERSLYYACRNYTGLVKGGNYQDAMPSIHIGLLDFTLFKKHVKFYATYKLLEEKDHYLYTDKLQIGVVDLTRIDLATPEDQEYNIDKWARLFKAKTWEDIKMVAVKDQVIGDAATTIYQLTADERIRQQCEAREDYLRRQRGMQNIMEQQRNQLEQQRKQLEEQRQQLSAMRSDLQEAYKKVQELEEQLQKRK
ncbi:MAG: Rpn family recombination-promoting nuclease/putative transposase [Lachnospiraceae bacterium]|nr:Rpn family recombination-promoting nuclease/putative transposase [Lachnospiraceae bacterium]